MSYTKEQLLQFINEALAGKQPDIDTLKAAGIALHDHLLAGKDLHSQYFKPDSKGRLSMNVKRKRGQRKKSFDPSDITIDHPVYADCIARAGKKITYTQLVKNVQIHINCSKSTAENIIKIIMPKARQTYHSIPLIKNHLKKIT